MNINELVDDQVNIHELVDDQVNANCVSFCLTLWSVDCLVLAFIHGRFALEYSLSHKTAYVGLHIHIMCAYIYMYIYECINMCVYMCLHICTYITLLKLSLRLIKHRGELCGDSFRQTCI